MDFQILRADFHEFGDVRENAHDLARKNRGRETEQEGNESADAKRDGNDFPNAFRVVLSVILRDENASSARRPEGNQGKDEKRLSRQRDRAEGRFGNASDHDVVGERKGKLDEVLQGYREGESRENLEKMGFQDEFFGELHQTPAGTISPPE